MTYHNYFYTFYTIFYYLTKNIKHKLLPTFFTKAYKNKKL